MGYCEKQNKTHNNKTQWVALYFFVDDGGEWQDWLHIVTTLYCDKQKYISKLHKTWTIKDWKRHFKQSETAFFQFSVPNKAVSECSSGYSMNDS